MEAPSAALPHVKIRRTLLACASSMLLLLLPAYLFYCLACCCCCPPPPPPLQPGGALPEGGDTGEERYDRTQLRRHERRDQQQQQQTTGDASQLLLLQHQQNQQQQRHRQLIEDPNTRWGVRESAGSAGNDDDDGGGGDGGGGGGGGVVAEEVLLDEEMEDRKNRKRNIASNNINKEEVEAMGAATRPAPAPAPSLINGSSSGSGSSFSSFGTKKLPDAIIIGVKKGGTRALLEFIRVHPDVRAVGAEPHFFDRNYDRGLEWYRSLMPRTLEGQITMEKTPSYYVTAEAPELIRAMSPHTRLIVVVRDPVTRAISDYTQTLTKSPRLPSFASLAFHNRSAVGGGGGVDSSWSAVRIGLYAKHLEAWRRHFPLEQMLFVSGERLVLDPAGELARVQDFLGLKRIISDKHFYFNQTKGFPCLKKPEGSSLPHCLGKSKGRRHPVIQPAVVRSLREFYRPFNSKFYQMVGHDFGWD